MPHYPNAMAPNVEPRLPHTSIQIMKLNKCINMVTQGEYEFEINVASEQYTKISEPCRIKYDRLC